MNAVIEKKVNRRPLTKIQLQHAERRLQEASQRQLNALKKKHPAPEQPKATKLTDEQFYRAVATRKVVLRPLADIPRNNSYTTPLEALRHAFAAPADIAKRKAYDQAMKAHNELIAKASKVIEIRYHNALDALYLSDADKAMDIVEQFAEGK